MGIPGESGESGICEQSALGAPIATRRMIISGLMMHCIDSRF
jgi:hypothetical protein